MNLKTILDMENIIERLHNGDLKIELEKILSYDLPISISMGYDDNLDYPFSINVEDSSYFYANEEERNSDYMNLYALLKPKGYSFSDIEINGFRLLTNKEFNKFANVNINDNFNLEEICVEVEKEHSIFYVSFSDGDVIDAIEMEKEVYNSLDCDKVCILPQALFLAFYVK